MAYHSDLSEIKFGLLTAKEYLGFNKKSHAASWRCLCDCGNETIVTSNHLKSEHTKSCGLCNQWGFVDY